MPLTGFDTRVTWHDFTELRVRPAGEHEYATISCPFSTPYSTRETDGMWVVHSLQVRITVSRTRSWVVTSEKSDNLLAHEQGHFDITALGAREIYNRLTSISGESSRDLTNTVNDVLRSVRNNINDTNRFYDEQTVHGTNISENQRWQANILRAKTNPEGTLLSL